MEFSELLDFFSSDLFGERTGSGRLILYNPGRMKAHSGMNVITLGSTWQQASDLLQNEFQRRLTLLVDERTPSSQGAC